MRFDGLVLIGKPGSGKGSLAQTICERYSFVHFSMGHLLRRRSTDGSGLGMELGAILAAGKYVPDPMLNSVFLDEYRQLRSDSKTQDRCIVFDGFPRSISQLEVLNSVLPIERCLLLVLQVSDQTCRLRSLRRRICARCDRTYSSDVLCCSKCGQPVRHRNDDQLEMFNSRLQEFFEKCEPAIARFPFRCDLDAEQSLPEVQAHVFEIIDQLFGQTDDAEDG